MAGLRGVIDGLVEPAEGAEQQRVVAVGRGVAGGDFQRALEVPLGGAQVHGKERLGPAERGVPFGQRRIESDRVLRRLERGLAGSGAGKERR